MSRPMVECKALNFSYPLNSVGHVEGTQVLPCSLLLH